MYSAQVICDSLSPDGVRITTVEVEYPHAIHKDVMTHRALSRNFQSFRAYPPEKVRQKISYDPFVPDAFQARISGMGQGEAIKAQDEAQYIWFEHIDHAVEISEAMGQLDLAKAQQNFPLQDLTWIRGVITATDWDNFFALRLAKDAEGNPLARPEVYKIAKMMKDVMDASAPAPLTHGEWHLPYIDADDYEHFWTGGRDVSHAEMVDAIDWESLKKISTGRCARISYLTHDGKRDWSEDIRLYNGLRSNFHMSPFEHQATPIGDSTPLSGMLIPGEVAAMAFINDGGSFEKHYGKIYSGNFKGWYQHRAEIPNQHNAALAMENDGFID